MKLDRSPIIEPLALAREDAASMVGIGCTLFDQKVADGTFPKPLRIGGSVLWDVAGLRRAWKRFADAHGEPDVNPWDEILTDGTRVTQIRPKAGGR